jgi:hypothetical protein
MSKRIGRIVTGRQIRAARALLDWSRAKLARAAGLHPNAVAYWEGTDAIPVGRREPHACTKIRLALHDAGIEFVGHAKPGVRLVENTNFVMRPPSRARARHGVIRVSAHLAVAARNKTQPAIAARRKPSSPCGARTRTGAPCRRTGLGNGRCPNHGGLSSGPKTPAGRARIAEVQRKRWAAWRSHRDSGGP